MKNRTELNQSLSELGARLSDIIAEAGADHALARFSEEGRALAESVSPEDAPYVYHRISCMLAGAGLIAGQDEGEQCQIGD